MDYSQTFVSNETPSGVVDGVNTIFTTLFPIYSIEDFVINGVEYRDLTWSANIITLQVPPNIGSVVYLDYFRTYP